MTPAPTGIEKVCAICKEDCSGRPRTRDHRGRYYCTSCYQDARAKLTARRRAAKAAAVIAHAHSNGSRGTSGSKGTNGTKRTSGSNGTSDTNDTNGSFDLLGAALDEAMASACAAVVLVPCPQCSARVGADGPVCPKCGYNLETRELLGTDQALPSARMRAVESVISPAVAAMMMILTLGGGFGLALWSDSVAGIYLIMTWILAAALLLTTRVLAFIGSPTQGVLTLLVPLYEVWFVFRVNRSPHFKVMWILAVLAAIAGLVFLRRAVALPI